RKLKFHDEFKGFGICIYLKIISEIFRERGSYVEWDASTAFDIAEYFGIKKVNLVKEVVNTCCQIDLFDKGLLENENVLTSKPIQRRYVKMMAAAKRKSIKIPKKICLLTDEEFNQILTEKDIEADESPPNKNQNSEECGQNSEECIDSSEECGQNSEFERHSKVKKSKVNSFYIAKAISFLEKNSFFKNFLDFIEKDAYREAILLWFGYKIERNEMFKTEHRCRGELTQLKNASGNDVSAALKIVKKAIDKGWKGFYFKSNFKEISKNGGGENNRNSGEAPKDYSARF
ncbi:MAG: DUF4373 domain-containing protein, partial [Prevotellaceae bacterium]|nr:DUF4373 domain-containing protein [Prevotellaceae bacterium]